jgi:hypothetical protein
LCTLRDVTERVRAEQRITAINEQLRALSARVAAAREEESARIARDLHDQLGSALTSSGSSKASNNNARRPKAGSRRSFARGLRRQQTSSIPQSKPSGESPRSCDPQSWTISAWRQPSNGRRSNSKRLPASHVALIRSCPKGSNPGLSQCQKRRLREVFEKWGEE